MKKRNRLRYLLPDNDHLDGGADDDKLYGGLGDDTLVGGTDTIQMAAGVQASQVTLSRDGNGNRILTLAGGGDILTLSDWDQGAGNGENHINRLDGNDRMPFAANDAIYANSFGRRWA